MEKSLLLMAFQADFSNISIVCMYMCCMHVLHEGMFTCGEGAGECSGAHAEDEGG